MGKRLASGICLLLCALLWGSTFVAQIFGASYIGPLAYNSIRFLIGGIALLPLIAFRRKRGAMLAASKRHTILGGIFCGVVLCVASYFVQAGMADTTAGKAGFISALYILLVPLLRLLTGKKAGKWAWACVLIALLGMYFLCIADIGTFAIGYGDLMVLISSFFFAVHILAIDFFVAEADPVGLSSVQFLVTGLLSGILSLIFEDTTMADIWACKWAILYAGVFSCGVAYTLQVFGQRHAEPMQATLLMSTESVFSAASGWIVLGERFSGREFGGCILILVAVLAAQFEGLVGVWMRKIRKGAKG